MPRKRRLAEKDRYPIIETYIRKRFNCFETVQNKGTKFGRVDVVGLRDIGGDLSGALEVVAVEVKNGNQPFNTAVGQAYSYSVYAERCCLADARDDVPPFSLQEIDIASKLGVGLLAIQSNGRVSEILASPQHTPLVDMRLQLVNKLGYSQCTICGTFFHRGDNESWRRNAKLYIKQAHKEKKGFVYWLTEINQRKQTGRKYNYERRFICSDCVANLYEEVLDDLSAK